MSESILTGTGAVADLAPLEYRYALDAAMPVIFPNSSPIVLCNAPQLEHEVRQRLSYDRHWWIAKAGLWIEPLAETWRADLRQIQQELDWNAPLVILASRPMANLLAERKFWTGSPLGTQPGGLSKLYLALLQSDFVLEATYGIHSILAIALNIVSRTADRVGRPDLGDRLRFAARLHYCIQGPLATFSTLALMFARRKSS